MLTNIEFANPGFLYLLILLPLLGGWYWYKLKSNNPGLQLSSTDGFAKTKRSWRQYLIHMLFAFRILAIALLIVALARPQSTSRSRDVTIEGIDIVNHVQSQRPDIDRTLYWRKQRGKTVWKAVRQSSLKYVAKEVNSVEEHLYNLAGIRGRCLPCIKVRAGRGC